MTAFVVVVNSSMAHANLTNTCEEDPGHTWFVTNLSPVIVDVWSVSQGTLCPQSVSGVLADFSPARATGLSQAQIDSGVLRAVDVWNEESGSTIELRYRELHPRVCAATLPQ